MILIINNQIIPPESVNQISHFRYDAMYGDSNAEIMDSIDLQIESLNLTVTPGQILIYNDIPFVITSFVDLTYKSYGRKENSSMFRICATALYKKQARELEKVFKINTNPSPPSGQLTELDPNSTNIILRNLFNNLGEI